MKNAVYVFTAAIAATLCLGIANASGPIAVYALVDKITVEPNADKPERIRISGVFITAEARTDVYSEPRRGYLYFAYDANARREWADLKAIAGTRQVIGLGSSWASQVHVRKADEDAKSAEDYPTGNGLVKVNADQPRAKALLEYKDR